MVGTNKLDEGGEFFNAISILPHEKYNSHLIHNDIGLLKLDKDIEFNDKVQPIKLPAENFEKSDYPAVLSGWGTTSVINFYFFAPITI